MKKPNIFISYRRADAGAMAGRIKDSIEKYLPKATIFMDVDSIDGGADFKQNIIDFIKKSDVVLVLIGEHWAINASGENRLNDVNDFVGLEIAQSFSHSAKVIPVLINEAKMPHADILPKELRPITTLNAMEIRHSRYADDIKHTLMQAFKLKQADFNSNRWFSYLKSTLFGLISSATILFLIAFLNKLIFGRALNEVLGNEITIILLILVPAILISFFVKRANS